MTFEEQSEVKGLAVVMAVTAPLVSPPQNAHCCHSAPGSTCQGIIWNNHILLPYIKFRILLFPNFSHQQILLGTHSPTGGNFLTSRSLTQSNTLSIEHVYRCGAQVRCAGAVREIGLLFMLLNKRGVIVEEHDIFH